MAADEAVGLILALAKIWKAIQTRHPGVPDVVLLPAPSPHRDQAVLGHFAPLRWRAIEEDSRRRHEVVVVAEHLNRKPEDVLETLLHEASHALNCERGIKDASANQYHNRSFKEAAEELGLTVTQVPNYGFALTTLPPATATIYQEETEDLRKVLIHRISPKPMPTGTPTGVQGGSGPTLPPDPGGGGTSRSRKATCRCPFIIRVSKSVIEKTEIRCMTCGEPFHLTD